MVDLKERYLVDDRGNRLGVLLDVDQYQQIIEELEELESVRAYDAARTSGDEAILFEQVIAEIEREHS